MKTIIQRSLPLNVQYTCIDKKYVPLMDGGGTCCDNCGKPIANIATVKSVNGTYYIGFDCLETFLMNNNLLDGFGATELEQVKGWIGKTIRIGKKLRETIAANPNANITGLAFDKPGSGDYYPFYWLRNNNTKSRDNDYVKVKGVDFNFMIRTLKSIFPKLAITVNE